MTADDGSFGTTARDAAAGLLIESLYVYLPEQRWSTDEVLRTCRNPPVIALQELTGIAARRVAAEDEFSIDLAAAAVAGCLERSRYDASEIDLLICCNISRFDAPSTWSYEPSTATALKHRFGFTRAVAFDVSNACAGMWTAIAIAQSYFARDSAQRALIVSGDYLTHLTRAAQRELDGPLDNRLACLTVGDAGAAVIVERSGSADSGLRHLELQTYAAYCEYCIGRRSDDPEPGEISAIMYTEAVRMTAAAIRCGVAHAKELAVTRGVDWTRAPHVIMHQTSEGSIRATGQALTRALALGSEYEQRLVYNLRERGNTATTSHFVALWDQIHEGRIDDNAEIQFAISGSGLTVGSAVYVLDELPSRIRQHTPKPKAAVRAAADSKHLTVMRVPGQLYLLGHGEQQQNLENRQSGLELSVQAAKRCLDDASLLPDEIDLLVHVGIYRDRHLIEPATAALIAGKLRVNPHERSARRSLVFDLHNGPLGFLNACTVAAQMLTAGWGNNVLIVASDIDLNYGIDYPAAVPVERGCAILLSNSEQKARSRLFGFSFGQIRAGHQDREARAIGIGPNAVVKRTQHAADPALTVSAIRAFLEAASENSLAPGSAGTQLIAPTLSGAEYHAVLDGARSLVPVPAKHQASDPDLTSSALLERMSGVASDTLPNTCLFGTAAGGQLGCAFYQKL